MKLFSVIVAGTCAMVLSACQTTNYEKIANGPDLEYSKASCEIGAMSTEQGYMAFGSPAYVLGASLGNAIGNEIRRQEFIDRCMVLQGWRSVAASQAPQPQPAAALARPQQVSPRQAARAPRHRVVDGIEIEMTME